MPDAYGCNMTEDEMQYMKENYYKVNNGNYECWNGMEPEFVAAAYYCENFEMIIDEKTGYHRFGQFEKEGPTIVTMDMALEWLEGMLE